jgi:hypothetical protein
MAVGGSEGNRDTPVEKTLITLNALKILASCTNEGGFHGGLLDRMWKSATRWNAGLSNPLEVF